MIVTILLTTIVYLTLQRIDDSRREKNNLPPASWGAKFGLLFFVAIVCFVGIFLISNINSDKESYEKSLYVDGSNYETNMIQRINEPIHTGMPPF